MKLIGVGQLSEVFAVEDMGLVGDCQTASWEDAVFEGLVEEVVNFGPV